jgi:hypothetical protein
LLSISLIQVEGLDNDLALDLPVYRHLVRLLPGITGKGLDQM